MPSSIPMKDDTKALVDTLSQICGISPAEYVDDAIRFYIAKKFTAKIKEPKNKDLVKTLSDLIDLKSKQLEKLPNPRGNKDKKTGEIYSYLNHAKYFSKLCGNEKLEKLYNEIADLFNLPHYKSSK